MSRLVLRKRTKGRTAFRKAPPFWDANVPDFAGAIQNSFGKRFSWIWAACVPLAIALVMGWSLAAHAQDEPLTAEDVQTVLDNIWITVAAVLVIFMNAGFGMLETGFCRQKNAVNILSKNLIVFALATIAFWAFGFSFLAGALFWLYWFRRVLPIGWC
jgi:Amt family ammonium transporter